MNRLLSVLLIAAVASLFLAAAPEPSAPAAPIDLNIEIAPTPYGPYELLLRQQHPDTYTCRAMWLADEPHHRLYGSVSVVVRPGDEQTKSTTAGGVTMTMKGRVDADRSGAVAEVTVTRDGIVVAHQRSRVTLTRTGRAQIY